MEMLFRCFTKHTKAWIALEGKRLGKRTSLLLVRADSKHNASTQSSPLPQCGLSNSTGEFNSLLGKVVTIKSPRVPSYMMMLISTFLFLSCNTITYLLPQLPNGTCLVHQCRAIRLGTNISQIHNYFRIADISGELVNIFYTPTNSKHLTFYTITCKMRMSHGKFSEGLGGKKSQADGDF